VRRPDAPTARRGGAAPLPEASPADLPWPPWPSTRSRGGGGWVGSGSGSAACVRAPTDDEAARASVR
jgi:hypothetical protein